MWVLRTRSSARDLLTTEPALQLLAQTFLKRLVTVNIMYRQCLQTLNSKCVQVVCIQFSRCHSPQTRLYKESYDKYVVLPVLLSCVVPHLLGFPSQNLRVVILSSPALHTMSHQSSQIKYSKCQWTPGGIRCGRPVVDALWFHVIQETCLQHRLCLPS